MAGYNQGYSQDTTGTGGQTPSNLSSYNAAQDEFGQKEGGNYPSQQGYGGVSETVPPHHRTHNPNEPLPQPTNLGGGYGQSGYGDSGTRTTGTGLGGENRPRTDFLDQWLVHSVEICWAVRGSL